MRFRIDLKIFLFLILFYLTKQIEIYAMIMVFALIHELGHLLAGIILKMKPEKLEIMPFGVSIAFKIEPKDYNKKIKKGNKLDIKKIIVASAGPLTNLIIIIITYNLKIDMIKAIMVIYTNFLIMLFNLLPIYPLDGGRILSGILHIIVGKQKADDAINNISMISTILITTISSVLILYLKNIAPCMYISDSTRENLTYKDFFEDEGYKKYVFILVGDKAKKGDRPTDIWALLDNTTVEDDQDT